MNSIEMSNFWLTSWLRQLDVDRIAEAQHLHVNFFDVTVGGHELQHVHAERMIFFRTVNVGARYITGLRHVLMRIVAACDLEILRLLEVGIAKGYLLHGAIK